MGVTVLLDTHAFVWAVGQPDRLGSRAERALTDPSTKVLVSAATAWEVFTKARIGKDATMREFASSWDEALSSLSAVETPVTMTQAIVAGRWNVAHRDPFDRMLAAQSADLRIPLVTADQALITAFPQIQILW